MGSRYPDDPEKANYYFQGWYAGTVRYGQNTPINSSITLKAKWVHEDDAELFTVTFDSRGGSAVAPVKVLEWATLGSKYPIPAEPPDQISTMFAGWFYNLGVFGEEEVTSSTEIWDNITVSAKWDIPNVTVTFDTDGAPAIDPITVKNGDSIGADDFPEMPVKTDFLFRGWFKSDDTAHANEYTSDTPIIGNTTLKAYWIDLSTIPTFTITFSKNNDDAAGFTEAVPATLRIPTNEKIGVLPKAPTRSDGWGAGMYFIGWNTEADGSGDPVDGDTVAAATKTVYAQWVYQPGTPQVVGDTLVHYAPATEISGTANNIQGVWDGTENTEDGSVTYAGGAVRYRFPAVSTDYDLGDYDFFTVYYVAKNDTDTTPVKGSALKQFTSANSFFTRNGQGAPELSASGSLEFDLRDVAATEAVKGVALQNISDVGTDPQTNTVKWTKVVFTKGVRVQISFVTGMDPEPEPIRGVIGTPVGTLPVVTPPAGQYRSRWKDAADNTVTRDTVVTGPMTLTAEYRAVATTATWRVNFSSLDMFTLMGPGTGEVQLYTGAAYTGNPTGWSSSGYQFFVDTIGWENCQVKFKVTLPADTPLSAYTSVSFRVNAVLGGDNTYKSAGLVAGKPLPETFGGASPLGGPLHVCTNSTNNTWGTNAARTMTYTIDKAKSGDLQGEIEMCIYWHFPPSNNATRRAFQIYDVTFNP
jgi:hypothetical protein